MRIIKKALLVVCALVLWPSLGLATEDEAGKVRETLLETVTVTAQKREEDVQEVPLSVSVLSSVAIEDADIESTLDIQNHVPNLFMTHAGSRGYFSRIAVRGISNTGFGDPGVAIYIDDVPYSDLYALNTPIFDLERIEVLKGPQGTLYGKSTEGGAINIITRKPGNRTAVKFGFEAGSLERRQLFGSMDLPLVKDELFFRLSALVGGRDGYAHNVTTGNSLDSEETRTVRGSLFYTPSERWDITANLGLTNLDDGGFPMVPTDKSKYEAATGLSGLDDFEAGNDHEGTSKSEDVFSSLKIRYQGDSFDVLSISGLRSNENELSLDADFTPSPVYIGINTNDAVAYTQEFRVMSKPEQTDFKWLLGLFYGHESKDASTGFILDTIGAGGLGVPVGSRDIISAELIARDAAVFGQGTLRFLDEKLGVTAGLRCDVAHRSMDRTRTFNGVPSVAAIEKDTDFTEILPKLAVDYRFTEHIMAYGSFAQGYKAGGFSYGVNDPALVEFDSEKSSAFEVGFKSEFPEAGLRLNFAAFYTLVDDYQDRVQLAITTVIQDNASSMISRGIELESVYDFAQNWSLFGHFGYTDAKYDDYPDAFASANYDGNRVALVPEYDLGLTLQYRNSPGIMGQFEVRHLGKTWLNRENTVTQSPYYVANMKLGYETEVWDLYFSVENLTNEEYFMDAVEDTTLGFMGTVGPARSFRLSGSIRF